MKDTLIIINGAAALSSKNKFIQKIISVIYKYLFNFIPPYTTKDPCVDAFAISKYEIIELKWSGKIIPYDIPKASKKLIDTLKSNPFKIYHG